MQITQKRSYRKRKTPSPRTGVVTVRFSDTEKELMEKVMNELNIKSYSKAMLMALKHISVDYFDEHLTT